MYVYTRRKAEDTHCIDMQRDASVYTSKDRPGIWYFMHCIERISALVEWVFINHEEAFIFFVPDCTASQRYKAGMHMDF